MKAKNAYQYFWAITILIVFIGTLLFVSEDNISLVINIYDTYYVVSYVSLAMLFAPLYFFSGLYYRLAGKQGTKTNTALITLHTVLSIGGFICFLLLLLVLLLQNDPNNLFDRTEDIKQLGILIVFTLVALAQPLLIINILLGLIKAIRK